MRTIGFRSNVLFIFAAAFGLLAALGRPGTRTRRCRRRRRSRIGDVNGPVEEFFSRLAREFTSEVGDDRLGRLPQHGHDPGRARGDRGRQRARHADRPPSSSRAARCCGSSTLAMLGIVVVKLVNTPDAAGLVERRQGAWIALGVTGIMASSADDALQRAAAPAASRPALVPDAAAPCRALARHARDVFDPPGPNARGVADRRPRSSSARPRRPAAGPGSPAGSR